MPLKPLMTKPREGFHLGVYAYRIPFPVKKVRIFANGDSYPICPRCAGTLEREYMCFCDRCGQKLNWKFLVVDV